MRILIVASLLASVALPSAAFAADGPFGHRGQGSSSSSYSDSGQRHGGFGSRDDSPRDVQRSETPPAPRQDRSFAGRRDSAPPTPQAQPSGQARQDRPFFGRRDAAPQAPQAQAEQQGRQAWRQNRHDTAPTAAPAQQQGFRDRIERQREARRGGGGNVAPTAVPTNRSPVRSRTFTNGRDLSHAVWQHHDWRNDRRYDWRDYRRSNWSLFHFGFYNDPFGYGYNRFQIGWSLWPSYYGSNYWINDPWQYRLPPAYGPYRWVRYYADALLVDTYTGEVVDVVYDFFW